jgi:RNA polymerase-binding transcription factor DksA
MSEYSTSDEFTEPAAPLESTESAAALDLDRIEGDLADVEIALARLDSGEYWRDQVTGEPLDDALLAEHPTARRAADTIR